MSSETIDQVRALEKSLTTDASPEPREPTTIAKAPVSMLEFEFEPADYDDERQKSVVGGESTEASSLQQSSLNDGQDDEMIESDRMKTENEANEREAEMQSEQIESPQDGDDDIHMNEQNHNQDDGGNSATIDPSARLPIDETIKLEQGEEQEQEDKQEREGRHETRRRTLRRQVSQDQQEQAQAQAQNDNEDLEQQQQHQEPQLQTPDASKVSLHLAAYSVTACSSK